MTEQYFIPYRAHNETWWFIYREGYMTDTIITLGRWADNPELAFGWDDVYRVMKQMEELKDTAARTPLGKDVFRGGMMPPRGFCE